MKNIRNLTLNIIIVLALAALPLQAVAAAPAADETLPPGTARLTDERLEQIWARQLRAYERMGKLFDGTGEKKAKAEERLDQADALGIDTTAVRDALDALDAAVRQARPDYEAVKGIVDSHLGFDANGKVTDHDQALATIKQVREKMKVVRETVAEPIRNLRESIRDLREALREKRGTGGPDPLE
jgi:hypothetical protein